MMAFRLPNYRSQKSIELFEKAVETYLDKWFDGPSDWINLTANATSYSSTVFDLICDVAISPKLYKKALALGAKPKVFINYLLKNRMFFKRIVLQELLRIYK